MGGVTLKGLNVGVCVPIFNVRLEDGRLSPTLCNNPINFWGIVIYTQTLIKTYAASGKYLQSA